MSTNFSGNYMTFELQPDGKTWLGGPVVVVDMVNQSIAIDGIAIKNPTFTSTTVSWLATNGNSSSGSLTFYLSANVNHFIGKYSLGSTPLPSDNNLSGVSSANIEDRYENLIELSGGAS